MTVKFDLVDYINRQILWSTQTFGPGLRTKGVTEHIEKELTEIEEHPLDLYEWIDIVILGLDGAWRAGYTAEQIVSALLNKAFQNRGRQWPDWHDSDEDHAIEHIR